MNGTKLLSTSAVQSRASALAARLGKADFALSTESTHDGGPHLEVSDAYYFVVTERGRELERRRTTDVDELLYWIMEGLTFWMAWHDEVYDRRDGEDPRRQAFPRQVELLATLSPEWAERRRRKQAEVLSRRPFKDR